LKGVSWNGREVKAVRGLLQFALDPSPGIRYGIEPGNVLVRIGDTYIWPGITKDELRPLRKAAQKPAFLLFMRKQPKARALNFNGTAAMQKIDSPKYVSYFETICTISSQSQFLIHTRCFVPR
jgi:hypothetical protein